MDRRRLVQIHLSPGGGTGCLIGEKLVLTAEHVLRDKESGKVVDRVAVSFLDDPEHEFQAELRWHEYHSSERDVDAALLEITDPGFEQPQGLGMLWWTTIDRSDDVAVDCIGFPVAAGSTREDWNVFPVSGRLNPLSGACTGRYQVRLEMGETREKWMGMSGGPVLLVNPADPAGVGRLVGVTAAVPEDFRGRVLHVVPVTAIAYDPGAKELLDRHRVSQSLPSIADFRDWGEVAGLPGNAGVTSIGRVISRTLTRIQRDGLGRPAAVQVHGDPSLRTRCTWTVMSREPPDVSWTVEWDGSAEKELSHHIWVGKPNSPESRTVDGRIADLNPGSTHHSYYPRDKWRQFSFDVETLARRTKDILAGGSVRDTQDWRDG